MKVSLLTISFSIALLLSNFVAAAELTVNEAWARASIPGMANGAGYVSLTNNEQNPVTLVKVQSTASPKTELHTHQHDEGMMKMVHVPELTLAPGESLTMKPGSYHVMFFDLKSPFKKGDSIPLVMHFNDGSAQQVTLNVRELQ
ncbi:MAG: copper chaperone PCu(A)C [Pseudomonadota bacterium]